MVLFPPTISWVNYGWETAYGAQTGTKDKVFGHGVRVTSLTRRNNVESVFGIGARNAQKLKEKQFEGAISVEFNLANPWFFRGVLGAAPTTAGGGPYTHTWAESDTVVSMTLENNVSNEDKSVAALLGCKINTCVITAAVGELAKVRLDILYSTESHDNTTAAIVSETFELFTFAHGTIEIPNGTTITDIQNVELTMNNNLEQVYGLGDRTPQNCSPKNRAYTARITIPFEDEETFLEDMLYGAAGGPVTSTSITETATMELTFSNGLTGTSTRTIVLLFTGVQLDEENLPQDPTALIIEDVALVMRSLAVTAVNNTSAAV